MKDLLTINLNDVFRYMDSELYYLNSFGKISHSATYIDDRGCKVVSKIPGNKFRGKILAATVIWKMHYNEYVTQFDYADKNPLNNSLENLLPSSRESLNRRYKINNRKNSSGIKYVFKRKDKFYFYKYIFDDHGDVIKCTTLKADDETHARKLSEEQIELLKKNQWRN